MLPRRRRCCSVEVAVRSLNQPIVRKRAVNATGFSTETVQRGGSSSLVEFKNCARIPNVIIRSAAVCSSSIEISVVALDHPGVKTLAIRTPWVLHRAKGVEYLDRAVRRNTENNTGVIRSTLRGGAVENFRQALR